MQHAMHAGKHDNHKLRHLKSSAHMNHAVGTLLPLEPPELTAISTGLGLRDCLLCLLRSTIWML